ncbi:MULTISPECIES: PilZ domain-containing protein [unclassified Agarivorans]|uniref:PilZ domain-containing protein n=1 Tax=unclassified Agarivorans TaxID=2636026 RepID=UPI003D7CA827
MNNTELQQLERRGSMRLDLENEPVQLILTNNEDDEAVIEATCIDISRRGMLIVHDKDLAIGTKLKVKFTAKHSAEAEMKVKVARCHRKNFSSYNMFLLIL